MPFYEYEYMVEDMIEILEEKEKAESGKSTGPKDINPESYMKGAMKSMPKMSNFKFPSLSGMGLK